MHDQWAAEMIIEEVVKALEFSPLDPDLLPLNITTSWSKTERFFNMSNVFEIEEEFYHQTSGSAEVEAMLSCAYLLVKEYERCKEHLVKLLVCYQEILSKVGYGVGVGSHYIKYLPGYENLLNVYTDIMPADLALWFVDEILHMAEEINESRNKNNETLRDIYSMAKRLAKKAN